MSYRMAPIPMTSSDLECQFICLKNFLTPIHQATLCVYVDPKVSVAFNRNCCLKMTDFSWLQAVTYGVKVVVSKKWCTIGTLLLHTTNNNKII